MDVSPSFHNVTVPNYSLLSLLPKGALEPAMQALFHNNPLSLIPRDYFLSGWEKYDRIGPISLRHFIHPLTNKKMTTTTYSHYRVGWKQFSKPSLN